VSSVFTSTSALEAAVTTAQIFYFRAVVTSRSRKKSDRPETKKLLLKIRPLGNNPDPEVVKNPLGLLQVLLIAGGLWI
jgi:hypothetical protein